MSNSYFLGVKFGGVDLPINITNLKELTISQDLDKFLPEIRLKLNDVSGALTHIFPFDKSMSQIEIELALNDTTTDKNYFNFDVYRRQPGGDQSDPSSIYDVSGLLSTSGLFSPNFSRGFSGSVQETLETLALNELNVDDTDVSSSLDYDLNIIQPMWNNSYLLNYLTKNLIGSNGEYGYKCSIQTKNYKNIFLFKSLAEMMVNPVSYNFNLSDKQYLDRLPIFNWYIYDNYKLYGSFGMAKQDYTYFDWNTGIFISNTLNVQDYYSMSDYFAIDKSDSVVSNVISSTGRNNDFNGEFQGRIESNYSNRLADLVNMWITTQGLPNAVPGQTVQIFFPQSTLTDGGIYSYCYSGYWLVKKVVHNLGDVFLTKLLLCRQGTDMNKNTTLLPATNYKRF